MVVCRLRVVSAGGLGHVSADDLIHIIQRDILQADRAEGWLPFLRFLLNIRPLPLRGKWPLRT